MPEEEYQKSIYEEGRRYHFIANLLSTCCSRNEEEMRVRSEWNRLEATSAREARSVTSGGRGRVTNEQTRNERTEAAARLVAETSEDIVVIAAGILAAVERLGHEEQPAFSDMMCTLDALADRFYENYGGKPFGDLDSEVTDGEPGWVAMWCTCRAQIVRRVQHHSS